MAFVLDLAIHLEVYGKGFQWIPDLSGKACLSFEICHSIYLEEYQKGFQWSADPS